jgi:diaminohydroxyphosphoribosylaminopyrimidine deaminase/5-amino-6-(5-phosphoribosylamino)uracil reductase
MEDSKYIKRCIEIAKKGLGNAAPNPSVGCVIVCDNKIIGEGFTSAFGGAHAEVNAISSVSNKKLLAKSTLYVTLEPCCHHGKTPPCTNLIAKYEIPKVVIGCIDINEKVSGRGIEALKSAGCEVLVGINEQLCLDHHKRFFTFQNKKRPYIILKWAETKNGFIAPSKKNTKSPVWISSTESRQLVHQWRSEEHAILIGGNTVLEDNPSLTTRAVSGRNPVRIIIDTKDTLPKSAAVFNDEAKTIVLSSKHFNSKKNIAYQICNRLYELNILSVIVEGGQKTLKYFIDENIWDEMRVFRGDIEFENGIKGPSHSIKYELKKRIANDELFLFKNS